MKSKKGTVESENKIGPNTGFITRAIQLLQKGKTVIHQFGTSYRTYPVRITEIKNTSGGYQISGNLDYSEFPKLTQVFNGKPALISAYNPRTQKGNFSC